MTDLTTDEQDTRVLLNRCRTLAEGISDAERSAAGLRDRRLDVWKVLLARGVKAGDIATADGTLSQEAVRDAIRKDRLRAEAAAKAAAPRQRAPRPTAATTG